MLHPGAWWLWAIGLATAASRTTNPLLLALILAVAGLVVAARRPDAPWSRSFSVFLKLGVVVVLIRVLFQVVLGNPIGDHVLVTLPTVPLPDWLAAIRLGGTITMESIVLAACDGFRLATLLACVGAANSLASPSRLLKAMPAALYEIGVAVVVAMTFAPQLVADMSRVRRARRLRGRPDRGIRGVTGSAMPVFEGALDRAVTLAAAMDSRGYGRTGYLPPAVRRTTVALVIGGLIGVCMGLFGVLSSGTTGLLGIPVLLIGIVAAVAGLWLGGRRSIRTRYRPDPWTINEWLVSATGLVAAVAVIYAGTIDPASVEMSVTPLTWPALPPIALVGILLAALPALVAPPLPAPASARNKPVPATSLYTTKAMMPS
ncbi:MAG: energy-coupling factor transporter transmembrane component T [Actinomycetes bacterium]